MSIRNLLVRSCLTALFASHGAVLQAASLQVAPVLVDVPAPGATSSLKLHNEGTKPLDAQVRIFKWTQVDGADSLTPTDDVAASPPLASLRPNTDYTVRIVRTSKEPVAKEESYRLLVDELPSPASGPAASGPVTSEPVTSGPGALEPDRLGSGCVITGHSISVGSYSSAMDSSGMGIQVGRFLAS